MNAVVIGAGNQVEAVAEALSAAGLSASALELQGSGSEALAEALRASERVINQCGPDLVVTIGASDLTVAAAIAATKAPVALTACVELDGGPQATILTQLADRTLALPAETGELAAGIAQA